MARMKKTTRIAFDAVLSLLLIFEMFIQYTGDFLHEVIGFVFFATIISHLLFSRTWMASTMRAAHAGKLPARRRFKAIMGIALAACMLLLGVSSVAISQIIASTGFVMAGSYLVWKALHTFSSYALCILVVVHLTSHWASLASTMRISYDPSRRQAIGTGVKGVATLGAVALGVSGMQSLAMQQAYAAGLAAAAAEKEAAASKAEAASDKLQAQDRPFDERQRRRIEEQRQEQERQKRESEGSTAEDQISSGAQDGSDSGQLQDSTAIEQGSATVETTPQEDVWSTQETIMEDSGADTSTVSGICTLCRQNCPLSAPQCSKPYEFGLL